MYVYRNDLNIEKQYQLLLYNRDSDTDRQIEMLRQKDIDMVRLIQLEMVR